MQKTNKEHKSLKAKLKQKIKEQSTIKKIIILLILVILLASCIITITTQVIRQINKKQLEGKPLIEYDIKEISSDMETCKIVLRFNNTNGIENIKYISPKTNNEIQLNCNGKMTVAIDYIAVDRQEYNFDIKIKNEPERTEVLQFEIPRIKGNYTEIDGLYVNEPDLTGFIPENTRYMYADDADNLVPANWITDEKPTNWYNYKNRKWANIYSETNGIDSYYVWIPRYVYKVDENNSVAGNERMDIKFVDTYNKFIDANTGEELNWNQLKEQKYQLPEAFYWENGKEEPLMIPGYWMSKYQLSELDKYAINYSLSASRDSFNVSNFTNNVTSVASKYTYAINGKIVHESQTLENYSFINQSSDGISTINVTALNADGSIVGSMTKKLEPTEVNPPDLTGFDKDTTFYVYWDKEGNEHNEIPISQDPPKDWYNYTYSEWANIVTRNNGLESYYVWIPRYQYLLDSTDQRSSVQFIIGTGTEKRSGYEIPEAFTWGDNGEKQLTGYWMSKYQLSLEDINPRIKSDITAGSNLIRTGEIKGTLITDDVSFKYEYYINGFKVHESTNRQEGFVYDKDENNNAIEANKTYTINIIARNATTNAYVGAITNKIKTVDAYEPDLTGFDENNTFYVIYNDDGTVKETIPISQSIPNDWYDYSNRKWANIVTTANGTQSYFVWIPRYEYRILGDRANENLANKRTEINFITTDITNSNCTSGYQVPEAFTWGDNHEKQLKGYWISKYQLSQ